VDRTTLNSGCFWANPEAKKEQLVVQKRSGITPSFRMGTPTAEVTVRGTHFSVQVTKKNKTIVEVFEGLLGVEGFGVASPPVLIKPGFCTRV